MCVPVMNLGGCNQIIEFYYIYVFFDLENHLYCTTT